MEDSDETVQRAAIGTLGDLPVDQLVAMLPELVAKLGHQDAGIRGNVVGVLGKLPPEALAGTQIVTNHLIASHTVVPSVSLLASHSLSHSHIHSLSPVLVVVM